MSRNRLYVGDLPDSASQRDLESIFAKFGKINEIDMKRGYAYIEFADERDASEAMRSTDRQPFPGASRNLRVEVSKPKGSAPPRHGSTYPPSYGYSGSYGPSGAPGGGGGYYGGGGPSGGYDGRDRRDYDDRRGGPGGYGGYSGGYDRRDERTGYDRRDGYGAPPGGGYGYDSRDSRGGYDDRRGGGPSGYGYGGGPGGYNGGGGSYDDRRGGYDRPPHREFGGRERFGPGERNASRTDFRILVLDLPEAASWQNLKDFGRSACTVGRVNFSDCKPDPNPRVPGGKIGVVEYSAREDMENALKTLDTATVCGGRVRVIQETAETNFRALMAEAPSTSSSSSSMAAPSRSSGGGGASSSGSAPTGADGGAGGGDHGASARHDAGGRDEVGDLDRERDYRDAGIDHRTRDGGRDERVPIDGVVGDSSVTA